MQIPANNSGGDCNQWRLREGLAAIAAVGVLYVVTAALAGAGIVDDAYIFLRYVRNIWIADLTGEDIAKRQESNRLGLVLVFRRMNLSPRSERGQLQKTLNERLRVRR